MIKMNDENDNEVDIELIKNQLEKYMAAEIPVHIVLKMRPGQMKIFTNSSGETICMPHFLNGYIIGKKSNDVYTIDERKNGETYILVDEIFTISVFTKSDKDLAEDVQTKTGYRKGEGFSNDEINLLKDLTPKDEKKVMPDYKPPVKREEKTDWS